MNAKKLGFGLMRLPLTDPNDQKSIDIELTKQMVDTFIEKGFTYFDTAWMYCGHESENATRKALVERHPRDSFTLATKLHAAYIKTEDDRDRIFNEQLAKTGVEYFDYYLLHDLRVSHYQIYKDLHCFEWLREKKAKGLVKHMGFSFHDTAEVLDQILTEQPDIEVVQLQINYLDYDDPGIQSRACYDVAVKHGKKVIVMEPVKGGALANLPREAAEELSKLGEGSAASHALRFVASHPEVFMVLSGMGNVEMMNDNINTFTNFVPIKESDMEIFGKAREIIRKARLIPCTKCNYCADVCPSDVPISEMFSIFNELAAARISRDEAKERLSKHSEKLEACIKCGKCESNCPQSIDIRERLLKIERIVKG